MIGGYSDPISDPIFRDVVHVRRCSERLVCPCSRGWGRTDFAQWTGHRSANHDDAEVTAVLYLPFMDAQQLVVVERD